MSRSRARAFSLVRASNWCINETCFTQTVSAQFLQRVSNSIWKCDAFFRWLPLFVEFIYHTRRILKIFAYLAAKEKIAILSLVVLQLPAFSAVFSFSVYKYILFNCLPPKRIQCEFKNIIAAVELLPYFYFNLKIAKTSLQWMCLFFTFLSLDYINYFLVYWCRIGKPCANIAVVPRCASCSSDYCKIAIYTVCYLHAVENY